MSHQIEVPITEEFSNDQGRFTNYSAYDNTLRQIIAAQKHRDIRSFVSTPWTTLPKMGHLEGMTMAELQGQQVGTLDDAITVVDDENWTGTGVTVGPDGTRNYWNLLQIALSGTHMATSSTPNAPVDISSDFADDDFVTMALPGYPLSTITTAELHLSSADDGGFGDLTYVAPLILSNSLVALVNGNSEARWLLSDVIDAGGVNFDPTNVTGVRIVVAGTGTFKAGGLRVIDKDWKYLPVDIDTRYQVLRRTVSRTGLTTAPYDAEWPAMWRADEPSGEADPKPVDASIAVTFNTGSLSQTNQFTLYMRETNKDYMTQLDLNGVSQAALNGLPQPDIGDARWNPRPQTDLERYTQAELTGDEQFSLERTPDALSSSYIEFVFQWASTGGTVHIRNSEGNGYSFDVAGLTASTNYIGIAELEENAARAVIYPIDGAGNIDLANMVFDSHWIDDDFTFKRRKGRLGWFPQLLDGDAYIDGIRSRRLVFAEQRLLPYESITPVDGAQLFAEYSPNRELALGVDSRKNSTVTFDNSTSRGDTYRVTVTGAGQGIQTNLITFENFTATDARFSILVPQSAVNAGASLRALLTNDQGREIDLNLGTIQPDQWVSKHLPLDVLGDRVQTGSYRLAIVNEGNASFSFWVDKPMSISERTVRWSGRAVVDDPWKSNDAKWVDFHDQVNQQSGGALFYQRGNQLQVRGRALRQTAHLGKVKIKPKYAELGRLVFDAPPTHTALTPTGTFTVTPIGGRTIEVEATATYSNRPVLFEWSFGDGATDLGVFTSHTYEQAGTYLITLTALDQYGQRTSLTNSVTV
jgi:hypothetical protein